MIEYQTVYDISVCLGEESIDYPGDAPYSRKWVETIAQNGVCNLSKLEMSAHAGTHIDAPHHFISNGKTLSEYTPTDFILPAQVVNIENKQSIKASELRCF
ncbi:cyclase family protein, partial [Thermodesulfobacteriota bacterium]